MRFYTKDWYLLMQRQDYISCAAEISDKDYSEKEIRGFYRERLAEEIAQDRREYDTPPCFPDLSQQLQPEHWNPEDWLVFPDGENQPPRHPATPEEVAAQWERERRAAEEAFAHRPPFDPAETVKWFRTLYRAKLRNAEERYPAWVCSAVDRRLLALELLPESVYQRLKSEEAENRKAFQAIEQAAQAELGRQQIPASIANAFCFHDSSLLSLQKRGRDYAMVLRKDGGWYGDDITPYIRVIFRDAALVEREKGLTPRTVPDADGALSSNCTFLYHELYSNPDGYEVHMLFATARRRSLAYCTVRCRDIMIQDNIVLPNGTR